MAISFSDSQYRLSQLAKLLDNVPEAVQIDSEHRKGYNQRVVTHPCGAPACAWGHWYLQDQETTKRITRETRESGDDVTAEIAEDGSLFVEIGIGRATEEFGITEGEMDTLFQSHGCGGAKNGKEAAMFIRGFVEARRLAHNGDLRESVESGVDLI